MIVSVREAFANRSGSTNADASRAYTRVFLVETDDPQDGPVLVYSAGGLPDLGDGHPEDANAKVTSLRADQSEDPKFWDVTVEYSTETTDESGSQSTTQEDPLDRDSVIEWSFAQFQTIAEETINGDPIVNTAGDPFDPPLTKDDSRPVLTITRNEGGFDAARAIAFMDAVNEDAFFGAEPGQAKVANISARQQFQNGLTFYQVRYEFHFRREGWFPRVLNRGFRQLLPSFTEPVAITNVVVSTEDNTFKVSEAQVSAPVPLAEDGSRLPPGGVPVFVPLVGPGWEIYRVRNFADLNLP